jgi:AbrB family looped-hinge helix DNA binding protein
MTTAKITSKGQVTIPKEIRDRLGVRPGDRLVFRPTDGGVLVQAAKVNLLSLEGALKPQVRGVTVEDMKEAVRKRARA